MKKQDTILVHSGSYPEKQGGSINPPIYHASTVSIPSIAALEKAKQEPDKNFLYGRHGTPTSRAFEEAVAALELTLNEVALEALAEPYRPHSVLGH